MAVIAWFISRPPDAAGAGQTGSPVVRKSSRESNALPRRIHHRPVSELKEELEKTFASHEAARTRVLATKTTVDSDLYLLGVSPPTESEVRALREQTEAVAAEVPAAGRPAFDKWLQDTVAEFDPFGEEGGRVIQIDVPDEPNGRLTGFTCTARDFDAITEKFNNGEMLELENVRSYSAAWAGMPLDRFRALIAME